MNEELPFGYKENALQRHLRHFWSDWLEPRSGAWIIAPLVLGAILGSIMMMVTAASLPWALLCIIIGAVWFGAAMFGGFESVRLTKANIELLDREIMSQLLDCEIMSLMLQVGGIDIVATETAEALPEESDRDQESA